MKVKFLHCVLIVCVIPAVSCSQNKINTYKSNEKTTITYKPHRYGGWYCPDNLKGFPAVDIKDWQNVPVVNGRMATKEETQNGTSLIHVDKTKYPNAKPLDINMPQLARYYSDQTGKKELVIVIQALNISNDSIVGFRYLNGGNGSARLNEVQFLSSNEIKSLPTARFVNFKVHIEAKPDKIFEVLTKADYNNTLRKIYDPESTLTSDQITSSKVNFGYLKDLKYTSKFAGVLFGNKYIQIDRKGENYNYVEKFFLAKTEYYGGTELQIVCGPYIDDYEDQKAILIQWAQKVKELSEK